VPINATRNFPMSRQFEALAKRAFSYQKRQIFSNVCCIGLCPLLIVILSAALGSFLNTLVVRSTTNKDFVYCSNLNAMNNTLNVPFLYSLTDEFPQTGTEGFPFAENPTISHANFGIVRSFGSFQSKAPPGAAIYQFQRPCSYWYGEEYPFSPLYDRDPGVNVSESMKLRDA
jgi:hypothetical protein